LRFTTQNEKTFLILVVVELVDVIIIKYLFMQNKMLSIIVEKIIKKINSKFIFGDIVKMEILSQHIVVIHVQN